MTCPNFKYDETGGASSRPALFNAASVLWGLYERRNFLTFTLPSLTGKTYQRDATCPETGDVVIGVKWSKVMEAYARRVERTRGEKLSYVWVAEAQMKRQEKFGGVGDIHYHLVVNQQIKNDRREVIDRETLEWLQALWCDHVGVRSNNALHVDPIPSGINSLPAYFAKYFGKGTQRRIVSRRFGATRDLTRFKPITLTALPQVELIRSNTFQVSPTHEVNTWYFNTRETLETYGHLFIDEDRFTSRASTKHFTPEAIIKRAIRRQQVALMGSSYST